MTDPVALVVGILADALDVPVSTEVPEQRPDRLVLVSLGGGSSDEFIAKPRIEALCWGTSDADAMSIAIDVVHGLQEAAETDEHLSSAEAETIARDGWFQGGGARYRVVVDCIVNI